MRALTRLFVDHPRSVGETYRQHMVHAAGFAGRMIVGGCACLLHSVFPFLFTETASRAVRLLHDRMVLKRGGGEA